MAGHPARTRRSRSPRDARQAVRPRALTIAGSDSGGGAGIQADLKTFAALGAHGLSAIAALTAQDTLRVRGSLPVPPEMVALQIRTVLADIGADAAKTGMLATAAIVRAVARELRRHRLERLVVDPVLLSSTGFPLLEPEGIEALRTELLPLALVVTPNIAEAESLTGVPVRDLAGMRRAGWRLQEMGCRNVLITGGHLRGDPVDLLLAGQDAIPLSGQRAEAPHSHGSGCTFSAALTALLARGLPVEEAARRAKEFTLQALLHGQPLGSGAGPVDPLFALRLGAEVARLAGEMTEAIRLLSTARIGLLIPEVQSNLAAAPPGSTRREEVLGFPGRVVRVGDSLAILGPPHPGASTHMAAVLLTARSRFPEIAAAFNIRYAPEILDAARRAGLRGAHFDRRLEPRKVRETEGMSLEWGTLRALARVTRPPDLVCDRGGIGKEGMIRVLGRSPGEVAEKILRIARTLEEGRGGHPPSSRSRRS